MAKKAKKKAAKKRAKKAAKPEVRTKTPEQILADGDWDEWELLRHEHCSMISDARGVWCDLSEHGDEVHRKGLKDEGGVLDPGVDYAAIGIGIFMASLETDPRFCDLGVMERLKFARAVEKLCDELEGHWCT